MLKPPQNHINPNVDPSLYAPPQIVTTVHLWPSLEPQRFAMYEAEQLGVPFRRDLLHRAVIYEADASRQGTAWAPHRYDMVGSKRKVHQQKGTGKARASDRFSPLRKGGGVAHGPKPRDFSTELQKKIYDRAWRIALSHRYRLGQLVVIGNHIRLREGQGPWFLDRFFTETQWGKGNSRSVLVASSVDDDMKSAMKDMAKHGTIKDVESVDVKDLLSGGRVVIEQRALNRLLLDHSSDITWPKDLP